MREEKTRGQCPPVSCFSRCTVCSPAIRITCSTQNRKTSKCSMAGESKEVFDVKWGLKIVFSLYSPKEKYRYKEYEVSRQLLQQPDGIFWGFYGFQGWSAWWTPFWSGKNSSFNVYFLCFPGFSYTRFLWCAFNHQIQMCGNYFFPIQLV